MQTRSRTLVWGHLAFAGRRTHPQLHDYHHAAERIVRGAPQPVPAVLKPEAWPLWLGEQPAELTRVKALLAPYPSDGMVAWPVSARVGSVKNNDPSVVEPIVLS